MALEPASDIEGIIDAVYEALDDPMAWNAAWRQALRAFNGLTGCLYLESPGAPADGLEFLSMPGFSSDALALYGAHYVNVDPYAAADRQMPVSRVFLSQEIILPERFRESEVWVDYSSKYLGSFHIVGAGVAVGAGRAARISIHRPHDAQPFERLEARRFSLLLPHVTRALRIRTKLNQERLRSGARAAALDAMTSGIVVLDKQGRIVVANAAAEALGTAGHLLVGATGGELRLPVHEEGRRLNRLVANVVSRGPGGAMMATGKDSSILLALSVSRLPRRMAEGIAVPIAEPGELVLVVARDLAIAMALDHRALSNLFGLTQIEAEIAIAIGQGQTVEAIAEERARSVPTLRTQVRQILQKTGAASTRHLIAMLGRLSSTR